ncbi:hypothetical protein ACTA71_001331 [Dictyostelium dimigraforme]
MTKKRLLILILIFAYIFGVLSSSIENVNSDQSEGFIVGKEFNVLLPFFEESFIMSELECFQVDEKSSFKIQGLGDEMYVGINYFDGNCSTIEGEFQFKCTNNFMDIISCEFFKVACSNKLVIPFEKEKKKETILMELYGYKGDYSDSQQLLQVLNDFSKLPRTFSSPHKVAYADEDESSELQAIQINTKPTDNEIFPVIENRDDLEKEQNKTKISNENNINNNNNNIEKNNCINYLKLNNCLITLIILINSLILISYHWCFFNSI